jgi:hypothetical protein
MATNNLAAVRPRMLDASLPAWAILVKSYTSRRLTVELAGGQRISCAIAIVLFDN